jgi:hypothetical protein
MAKRTVRAGIRKTDLMSWNFIMFLTLAFILLVVVLSAMNRLTFDLRSQAGYKCPLVMLPRAEDCSSGWVYKRSTTSGCLTFFCNAGTPMPTSTLSVTPIPGRIIPLTQ